MAPNLVQKNFPSVASLHIPDSVTSGSMVSQDTPTPSPKRRKVGHSKLLGSLPLSEDLDAVSELVNQTVADLFPTIRPQEKSRFVAIAKEKELDIEDGPSSEVDDMNLTDFDTEGISKEELELWSRHAPEDQKLVTEIEDSPIKKSAIKVHFSNKVDVKGKDKYAYLDRFIRRHPFYVLQQTSSFTTSQRKAFEMDVFQQARELGFSSASAEKQIIHARRLCGEKEYHGSRSKLDNEVSDSETVTRRDSTVVDCDRVENRSSTARLPSVRSFQDVKSTESSNRKDARSDLEDQAAEALEKARRKRGKRRRKTSSAEAESTFSETQAQSNSRQADPDNQHSPSQSRLQDPKSDTVNGDPSQLLEVPEDVSRYLEVQARKKRAKKERRSSVSTLDVDMRDAKNDPPNGHDLEDNKYTSEVSQAHAMSEMLKDETSDKPTDRKKRHRHEESRRSSVEPNYPRQERTVEQRAERRARKRERRQQLRQQAQAKANLESGATSPRRELQASVDPMKSTKKAQGEIPDESHKLLVAKSAEDGLDMRKPLDEISGENVSHPRKHKKKKKHKPKDKSLSKESGFQSPMIQ